MADGVYGWLEESNWLISYYYKRDPAAMSDEEYACALVFLKKIREAEAKALNVRF